MSAAPSASAPRRYRVGIIGLTPDRSWGATAHVPALRGLSDDFEIVGVANSSKESGEKAAAAMKIPRAFASPAELAASPDVDIVAVTVKVPHHAELVRAALAAKKHVYCEWPLGNGLAEARELAQLAKDSGVMCVIGAQAPFAPEIIHLRRLIKEGFVGKVLSTTLTGTGMVWGPQIDQFNAYTNDKSNGATMLSIPIGHTLSAVVGALGPIAELSAVLANRRTSAHVADLGKDIPMTSPDQVLLSGLLESGAPISLHYRGGTCHGSGFVWEVNGTEGELRISGPIGHSQLCQLSLSGAKGDESSFQPIALPADLAGDVADGPVAGNVRRVYAAMLNDLRNGTSLAPTFEHAIHLHQIVAAVEEAAASGKRVQPSKM